MSKFVALLKKDLRLEMQTRGMITTMLLFGIITTVVISMTLNIAPKVSKEYAPALLFIVVLFAQLLTITRNLELEAVEKSIYELVIRTDDPIWIYWAKWTFNMMLMSFVELILIPLFFMFLRVDMVGSPLAFFGIVFLANLGMVGLGVLFATVSVNLKLRQIMLPILLLPLEIPLLLAATECVKGVFNGFELAIWKPWLYVMVIFDLVFLAVSHLTFPYLLEDL